MRSPPVVVLPGAAFLWALLAAGHALVTRAPLPAKLQAPAALLAGILAAGSLLAASAAARRPRGVRRVGHDRAEALLGVLALLAAGAALGAEADAASWPLPVHPRPVRVRVEGRVLDTTALEARSSAIVIEATRVEIGSAASTCRARIVLRFPDEAGVPRWAVPGLGLAAEGRYSPPEDARNPGVEAPGRWMERLGLEGTVDVDPQGVAAASGPGSRGAAFTDLVRDRLARSFDESLAPPVAALVRGILLGDRSRIEPAMRDAFRDGGTIHILSISGLHVCILGGFAALAAAALRLSLAPALAAELLAVWGYTLLVGAPPSALRAALLWTAVRGGRAVGREVRPLAAWGLAGLLLHLIDPRFVHDPGFQLSFAAVLGLLAAGGFASGEENGGALGRARRWLRGAGGIALQSAAATAGTLGIAVRLFGAIPVAGLLLNLAVVPLCSIVMAESFLMIAVLPFGPSLVRHAASGAFDASGLLLLAVNAWGARLVAPWPVRAIPPVEALGAAAAALFAAAALREGARHAPRDSARRGRAAAFALLAASAALPLLPWPRSGEGHRKPYLLAVDVGQGDALLARTAGGRTLLVDAGPSDESRDLGRLAMEPALRAERIEHVDVALLSHAHRDHYGGLAWLARRGWIGLLFENGSDPRGRWRRGIEAGLRSRGGHAIAVRRDTTVLGGALILWAPPPDSSMRARGNAAENNRSLVGTLLLGTQRVLLPGDAEEEAERAILPRLGSIAVLKAPHHGSRTSSSAPWIARLAPSVVLVSCGERNRFGHPDAATVGRYRLAGARVRRTDREGAIRVTFARAGLWVSSRAHPEPEWVPLSGP